MRSAPRRPTVGPETTRLGRNASALAIGGSGVAPKRAHRASWSALNSKASRKIGARPGYCFRLHRHDGGLATECCFARAAAQRTTTCFAVDNQAGDGQDGWVFLSSRTTTMDAISRGAGSPLARGPGINLLRERRMNVGRHAGLRSTHKADDQDNQQNDHQKPNESVARPSNSKRQHVVSFRRSAGLSPQDAGILGISGARAFAGAIGRGTRIAQNADSCWSPTHLYGRRRLWPPAPSSAYQCRGTGPTLRPGASRHARAD
jgi:hypothetical protein